VKLKHLAEWNAKRRERAAEYNRLLAASEAGVRTPFEPSWSRAVYHLYVVRTEDREGMMAHLGKAGIGTGIHYPIPLHRQRAYDSLGYEAGDFPVCEKIAAEIVSLPMYPQLTAEQQARVVRELAHFVKKPVSSEAPGQLATTGRTA
jgi:dTDP-4-amino-4,6-dideoxygalactose transaminase